MFIFIFVGLFCCCLNHWREFCCYLLFSAVLSITQYFMWVYFMYGLSPLGHTVMAFYASGMWLPEDKTSACSLLSVLLLWCVNLRGLFRKHTVKMWMGSSQAATEALLHTIRQMPQLWELLTKYLDLSCVVLDKLWLMPISWLAVVLFRFIFPEASLAFKCAVYSKIQPKLDPGGFFNAYLGYPALISNSENTGVYVLSI